MKETFIYISIIIIFIFKNYIIQTIIDFNVKHNVANMIHSNYIIKFIKNFNLKNFNLKNINFNNINFYKINFTKINITKIKIVILICLFLYLLNKNILNLFILAICSVLVFIFYNKINFILNQLINIYNNSFLINKFILV